MTSATDILIIGGGISGFLTALELAAAGCQVTILDKSAAAREASWAGGGILLPIYPWRQSAAISDLVGNSLKRYPPLCAKLDAETGIDPEWTPCGMLICKNPDITAARAWCLDRGITHHPVTEALTPGLNTQLLNPLWLPDIAQVRNPRLLRALQTYLLKNGVRILEHSRIVAVERRNNRLTAILSEHQRFTPHHTVVCAGAWSAEWLTTWLPDSALQLPIKPVRGQMLLFDAEPDTLSRMVLDGDHYLIPRRDGKILAGSTVESAGFDKTTTDQAKSALYRFATELLPALKKYPIAAHWAGLRPGTPDGVPFIGPHPEIENLSINAGHFRNGLVMGPASAALLADLILQRPSALDPSHYALKR